MIKIIFTVFQKKLLTNRCACDILLKRCKCAGVAQLVEQLICNQQVRGSSPVLPTKFPCCRKELLQYTDNVTFR